MLCYRWLYAKLNKLKLNVKEINCSKKYDMSQAQISMVSSNIFYDIRKKILAEKS